MSDTPRTSNQIDELRDFHAGRTGSQKGQYRLKHREAGLLFKEIEHLQQRVTELDRSEDQLIGERDRAQDALQETHIALGGDGEWVGRSPPQPAPDSGDLVIDVPELARERFAEIKRLRASVPPTGWQPIETAPPTDRNNPVYVAYPHFNKENRTLIADEYSCFAAYCDNLGWDSGFWRLHEKPHYWHPLPKAPTVMRDGLQIGRTTPTKSAPLHCKYNRCTGDVCTCDGASAETVERPFNAEEAKAYGQFIDEAFEKPAGEANATRIGAGIPPDGAPSMPSIGKP